MKKRACLLAWMLSLTAQESTNNLHRYIMANYHQFGNNLTQAEKWYSTLNADHSCPYIYYGYIPYLYAHQQYRQIVNLIPTIDTYFKNNSTIQMIFAESLIQSGNKDEGTKRLILLNEAQKSNAELAFRVVQLYIDRKELENALLVIDNLLNNSPRRPTNYIFLFVKSQIFIQLNKKEEALAAVQACLDIYPKFDKGWLFYAMLHEQEGQLEQAIKGYTNFLETTTEAVGDIQRHLLQLTLRQKLLQQHGTSTLLLHADPLQTALTLIDQKKYLQAAAEIERILQKQPHSFEVRLLKLQMLTLTNQHEKALALVKEWIMKEPADRALWLQALYLMGSIGISQERTYALLQEIEKNVGKNALLSLYRADYALRLHKTDDALTALTDAYEGISDTAIKNRILFQQAQLQYQHGNKAAFEKLAQHAHALKTDFAPLLNLIAYAYALEGKDLEHAQQYISAALKQDPLNIAYKDTQALIWYKKQHIDQAIALLEDIAPHCSDNCTVLSRLGSWYLEKGVFDKAKHYLTLASSKSSSAEEKKKIERLLQGIQ